MRLKLIELKVSYLLLSFLDQDFPTHLFDSNFSHYIYL